MATSLNGSKTSDIVARAQEGKPNAPVVARYGVPGLMQLIVNMSHYTLISAIAIATISVWRKES